MFVIFAGTGTWVWPVWGGGLREEETLNCDDILPLENTFNDESK
jgi:hypothetical protein